MHPIGVQLGKLLDGVPVYIYLESHKIESVKNDIKIKLYMIKKGPN